MLVFILTHGVCRSLQRSGAHPLRAWQGAVLRRNPDGTLELIDPGPDRDAPPDTMPPVGTVPGREYPTPRAED
jgi:hypothetical protein